MLALSLFCLFQVYHDIKIEYEPVTILFLKHFALKREEYILFKNNIIYKSYLLSFTWSHTLFFIVHKTLEYFYNISNW